VSPSAIVARPYAQEMSSVICTFPLRRAVGVQAIENHSDGVDRSTLALAGVADIAV
jgi:hypothetical protein